MSTFATHKLPIDDGSKNDTRIKIERVDEQNWPLPKFVDYNLKHQWLLLSILYVFDVVTELMNEVR